MNDMKMTTISESLLSFLAKKNGLKLQMNSPYPYRLCKIRDSKGDISKTWYVEYYVFDIPTEKMKRKRVVVNQQTAKERYQFANETKKEIDKLLKEGVVNNSPETTTIKKDITEIKGSSLVLDAIDFFLKHKKAIVQANTLANYTTDINRFRIFLKKKQLESIKLHDFSSMKALNFFDYLITETKISNRSRNNTTDTLSTFFAFFVDRKIITDNPFESISDLPAPARKHAAFTKTQAKEIMQEAKKETYGQLYLFLSFIYYTFLRPTKEVRLLKVKDIKNNTLRICAENAKDDETEHVMIPPPLRKIIDEYGIANYPDNYYVFGNDGVPGTKPPHKKYFYYRHRQILEKFGLLNDEYDVYGWKHTGVIALWEATQNIELIRQQCRHADIATTQRYLRDLGQFVDYDQINKFPEI